MSFLGLGDPTVISWGALLGGAQHFVREAWWMSVFPGIALTLTVLACNLIADSLVAARRLDRRRSKAVEWQSAAVACCEYAYSYDSATRSAASRRMAATLADSGP